MKNITLRQFIEELTIFAETNNMMDAEVISIGTCCGEFNNKQNPYTVRLLNGERCRVAYINSSAPKPKKKPYTFGDVKIGEQFIYGTGKNKRTCRKITPYYIAGEKDPRMGIDEPGSHVNAVNLYGAPLYFHDNEIVHKYKETTK